MSYYEKVASDPESETSLLAAGDATAGRSPRPRGIAVPRRWRVQRLQIVVVCLAYALVGPTLVLVNNHILRTLGFPFPLILSSIGLVTTGSACAFYLHVVPLLRRRLSGEPRLEGPDTPTTLPGSPRFDIAAPAGAPEPAPAPAADGFTHVSLRFWLANMVPIGAAQGLTFASTNAAYMYLTITFTQMLAAFTPTVTLVLLYLFGVEVPTPRTAFAVLLIGVGCAVSSYGEGHFDVVGVAFRSLGIFSEATRLVLTQKLLKNHQLTIVESQYYLAPIGAGFLLIGAALTEARRFIEADAVHTIAAHPRLFVASAMLGLVASMLTFLVIKLTNSVTLKVINTARNAAFVLFTVGILGERASSLQVGGYALSLAAFCLYLYFKISRQ